MRDRVWREAEARLGWAAIVGYGYEAGSWIKLAVTTDVEAYAKVGRSHHPEDYRERFVSWVPGGKDSAEVVLSHVLEIAGARRQRLSGSCVAMPVAGARGLVDQVAAEMGVELSTTEAHRQAVAAEMRNGWR